MGACEQREKPHYHHHKKPHHKKKEIEENEDKLKNAVKNQPISEEDDIFQISQMGENKIQIKFCTKDKEPIIKVYDLGKTLEEAIDEMIKDPNFPKNMEIKAFKNENVLNNNKTLKELIEEDSDDLLLSIQTSVQPATWSREYIDFIGKPIFEDKLEIFVFEREGNTLKIEDFNDEISSSGLNVLKGVEESGYCNGKNHLYICGGTDRKDEAIDFFWDVDLQDKTILKTTNLPEPKTDHSMIFIPDKYIFIVGGEDKNVFYYGIETKKIREWAELNKVRTNPALIKANNYLYCFENLKRSSNSKFTIERTNLIEESPKWELITPNLSSECENILDQKFFGVDDFGEGKIIFLGGIKTQNLGNDDDYENLGKNYIYNYYNNTVNLSNVPFKNFDLGEKTFMPLKATIDFIIPEFSKEDPSMIFFNKIKNKIYKISYKVGENRNTKSFINNMSLINNNNNKITIGQSQNQNVEPKNFKTVINPVKKSLNKSLFKLNLNPDS